MATPGRYWDKHPKKELDAVLGEYADARWRIERAKGYYRVYCPCGKHMRSIHLSPSDPNYVKNALGWLYRQPCYEGSD